MNVIWVKNWADLPPPPIEFPVAICHSRGGGKLHLADGIDLWAVTDPYTGEQIALPSYVTTIIPPDHPLAPFSLSPIFLRPGPSPTFINRDGVEMENRPVNKIQYSSAMLNQLFTPK